MFNPELIEINEKKEAPKCRVEILDAKNTNWEEIKKDILDIENSSFNEDIRYDEDDFKEDFYNKNNVVVFLRLEDGSKKIIGYTYSEASDSGDKKVAYIGSTAILEEYRNMGLVAKLMGTLEEKLRERGYKFIERESMIKNGYAQKIEKHYNDGKNNRIIENRPSEDNEGDDNDRTYFKIKL